MQVPLLHIDVLGGLLLQICDNILLSDVEAIVALVVDCHEWSVVAAGCVVDHLQLDVLQSATHVLDLEVLGDLVLQGLVGNIELASSLCLRGA